MTIVDVINGYVTLPQRFRDAFQVMPEDGMYYWGVLVMWIAGGGFMVGLGAYGLYEEKRTIDENDDWSKAV